MRRERLCRTALFRNIFLSSHHHHVSTTRWGAKEFLVKDLYIEELKWRDMQYIHPNSCLSLSLDSLLKASKTIEFIFKSILSCSLLSYFYLITEKLSIRQENWEKNLSSCVTKKWSFHTQVHCLFFSLLASLSSTRTHILLTEIK